MLRHTLPFERVPKYVLIYMVFAATRVMNMFPHKGSNNYYSPGMIMTEAGVSISDLKIAFELYVKCKNSAMPHNGMATHSRGAIWLVALGNATDGHVIMSLNTGTLLRLLHVKVVTMTAEVSAWIKLPWMRR